MVPRRPGRFQSYPAAGPDRARLFPRRRAAAARPAGLSTAPGRATMRPAAKARDPARVGAGGVSNVRPCQAEGDHSRVMCNIADDATRGNPGGPLPVRAGSAPAGVGR